MADFDGNSCTNVKDVLEGTLFESPMRPMGGVEQITWMVGLPVGVMKKLRKAHTDEYTIEKGESIVFYTDGIVEVTGKTEEQYGYNRFKSVLSANASKSANEIMATLFNYYDNWLSGTEPDDDVTLVVLKRKNN